MGLHTVRKYGVGYPVMSCRISVMRAVAQRPNACTPMTEDTGVSITDYLLSTCITATERVCTDEADSSAYEGVEVTAGSVDVSFSSNATFSPGQAAEQDDFSDHDLKKHRLGYWIRHIHSA